MSAESIGQKLGDGMKCQETGAIRDLIGLAGKMNWRKRNEFGSPIKKKNCFTAVYPHPYEGGELRRNTPGSEPSLKK